jgi:hypothetical protein
MLRRLLPPAIIAILIAGADPLRAQVDSTRSGDATVSGVVYDSYSGRPVPFAIIRVVQTDSSTLTDRKGRYRLRVPLGETQLEFRQIGFAMAAVTVTTAGEAVVRDVSINRLAVPLDTLVVSDSGESRASRIIRRAIARKIDVLSRIQDYSYDAYVKLVITDLGKHEDSAEAVLIITETETTAYWQQPDGYQEVITGRRQSSNLAAEDNLVTVGQIVNFNRDRIDLEKYSVVSPTASDALYHYTYHLVDSLAIDDRKVFRLAIAPNTDGAPLFVGMIDIADSTYDILAIDVGLNEAVRFDFFENLRYRQRLRDYDNGLWMPAEITFSGEIRFGIPIPGVPKHLSFQHQATLADFRFDQGDVPGDIGAFVMVVDEGADDIDSTAWNERRRSQLTDVEQKAYARIDSISSRSPSLGSRFAGGLGMVVFLTMNQDFFHFNRTESAYLGAGWTWQNLSRKVTLRTKLGYSFGRDEWQYELGAWYRVFAFRGIWVGGSYHSGIVNRPTIVSSAYNPTYLALLVKLDPLNYLKEEGVNVSVRGRLTNHSRLTLEYHDYRQSSVSVATGPL